MNEKEPDDANKLRLTQNSFQLMLEHFHLDPLFISALSELHLPSGRGFASVRTADTSTKLRFWYILPVRTQYECHAKETDHASSTASSNQMDPFHYLHLPDAACDIRGSHIAVACEYPLDGKESTTISFNFMHGRWPKSVEEPKRRLVEVMKRAEMGKGEESPFFMHTIYFSSSLRWYMHAFSNINLQLIAYEKMLQKEIDGAEAEKSVTYNKINRALHSMAAHLHRCSTELGATQGILEDLLTAHEVYSNLCSSQEATDAVTSAFMFIESQLNEIRVFLQELESKLKNILALVGTFSDRDLYITDAM